MTAAHPSPRPTPDGRVLVSRHLVAWCTGRHVNLVRRKITPVACDVGTRAALLDLDQAQQELAAIPQRLTNRLLLVHPEVQ